MCFSSLGTGSRDYFQLCVSEWHRYLGDIYPNPQADSSHICPNENSGEDLRCRSLQISDDLSGSSSLLSSALSCESSHIGLPTTQGVHCALPGVPSVNDMQQKTLGGELIQL